MERRRLDAAALRRAGRRDDRARRDREDRLRVRPDRIERARSGWCSKRNRYCKRRRVEVSEFGWQPIRVPPALLRPGWPSHNAAGSESPGRFQKDPVSGAQRGCHGPRSRLRDFRSASASRRVRAGLCVLLAMPAFLLALSAHAAVTWSRLTEAWPDNSVLREAPGIAVSWPSSSPFAPEHIGADPEENPPTAASGRLFLPP